MQEEERSLLLRRFILLLRLESMRAEMASWSQKPTKWLLTVCIYQMAAVNSEINRCFSGRLCIRGMWDILLSVMLAEFQEDRQYLDQHRRGSWEQHIKGGKI